MASGGLRVDTKAKDRETDPDPDRAHSTRTPAKRPRRKVRYGKAAVQWTAHEATRPLLLTFDAFGTLFHPRDPIETQYCQVARTYGLELSEADVLTSFRKAYKALSASHPNYGKATNTSPAVWWSTIIRNTLRPLVPDHLPLPNALVTDLYNRFASAEGYALYPDLYPFLEMIGASYSPGAWPPRRTMLGILSNSDPRVRSILKSFDMPVTPALFPPQMVPHKRDQDPVFGAANFSFTTLSYDSGFAKPDPGIYDAAIRDAQWTLERIAYVARTTRTGYGLLRDVRADFHAMHVGDELEKDVIPAIRCGWDGVLLDREAQEEVSEREVQVPLDDAGKGDARKSGTTRTIKIPVINHISAIRSLLSKERIEEKDANGVFKPRQAPVYIDESRSWERFKDGLPRRGNKKSYYAGRTLAPHPDSTRQRPLSMYV